MAWRNETIEFEILKPLGVICETRDGWHKEINIVSWNNRPPKIDIREWSPDHTRMSKACGTFTEEETEQVCMILHNYMRERSK